METMKKQYIQPATDISKMVCIHSIMEVSGINTGSGSEYRDPNPNIPIGTKERNEWGNIGGDDMTYGSIW